jgi:protein involved in polysaccharide export with SLBB domain
MEIARAKYLIIWLLFAGLAVQGQELFYRKNLANIDVSKLSQQEISRFQTKIAGSNMSEGDVISYLMEKGLSRSDVSSLLKRIDTKASPLSKVNEPQTSEEEETTDPLLNRMYLKSVTPPDSMVFGSELFSNGKLDFTPNLQIATPVNYILGPGDEVNLTLFGDQEVINNQVVDPSGRITMPYAGVVQVGGLTVEQTEEKLKGILTARGFNALESGETKITVSLKKYRTIPVMVIGAKNSGKYMLPSIASAFHALVMAGGPNARGTYRSIEVIRHGKIIQQIDLYKFIVNGDRSADVLLKENDVINIPVYNSLVRLKGEVKRPGFFELIEGENLDALMKYAGGFTPIAYKDNIYIEQVGTNEFITRDILQKEFSSYFPASGDVMTVGSISDRFYNRIMISGAVNRPGTYGWDEGMQLSHLMLRAGGLEESALLSRGIIYRSGRNHENEYLRFNPKEVSEGLNDIPLKDGDSVVIGDKRKMFPYKNIQVVGEVNNADKFTYGEGMTALDAIMLAGGMKYSANINQIVITRKLKDGNDIVVANTIKADSDAELIIRADEVMLLPGDIVIVRPDPDMTELEIVTVKGEVTKPGAYVLLEKNERLSSVLDRAGGLTQLGDENGVLIIRSNTNPIITKRLKSYSIQQNDSIPITIQDTLIKGDKNKKDIEVRVEPDYIAINNMTSLMKNPGGKYDINMQKGDSIVVLMRDNTVSVRGMVNNQVIVNHMGKRLKHYINESGGTMKNAQKSRIFVVEPNGRARMTRQFMGIRKYPHVVPGSIVVVPEKEKNKGKIGDAATLAAIASILASATTIVLLITTLK